MAGRYANMFILSISTLYENFQFFFKDNGPKLISSNVLEQCNISNFSSLMTSENRLDKVERATMSMKNCISKLNSDFKDKSTTCDINILPFYYAFPYHYSQVLELLFSHDGTIDISRIIQSYCIHFNSFITNQMVVSLNENSFYEFFATYNCPIVHSNM